MANGQTVVFNTRLGFKEKGHEETEKTAQIRPATS
jgi:hypothetical protein